MVLPQIKNIYICGIIIALSGMEMGLGLGFTGPTTFQLADKFKLSKPEQIWFNVAGFAAAMVGSMGINPVVSKFGNRSSLFGNACFMFASWIALSFSVNKIMAFVFRCLTGLAVGCYSTVAPVFIVDIAPVDKKGLFAFMNQLGFSVGYLTINIFGNMVSWAWLARICAVPCLIQIIFTLMIPQPIAVLLRTSFKKVFHWPKQIVIAIFLMFFLQFSGVNAVLSNLNSIITEAKLNVQTSIVAICTTIAQLLATLAASTIVDKFGHRICWTVSSIGQMVAFLFLWAFQKFKLHSAVFMVGLFLEQFTFGIGTGPIPFAKTANLFKVEVRSSAMGIATAAQWFIGGVVVYILPTFQDLIGTAWTFMFFAVISFASVVFGAFVLIPETDAGFGDNKDEESDKDTEEISRRLSHVKDIPEL